jgi:hypothetical protein
MIRFLGVVPGLRGNVFLIAGVWMLFTVAIAVGEALSHASTCRALGLCLIGLIVQAPAIAIVLVLTGVHQEVTNP